MFSTLFFRLGGGVPAMLTSETWTVSDNSRSLISRLGISVLATAIFKFGLLLITLNYILDAGYWNVLIALVVIAIILSFDVLLLATCWSDHEGGMFKSVFKLLGRIVFALAISCVLSLGVVQFIAGPLIIEQFNQKEREINAHLYDKLENEGLELQASNEEIQLEITSLQTQRSGLNGDLRSLLAEREEQYEVKRFWESRAISEETGVNDDGTTGAKGTGPKWEKAKSEMSLAQGSIDRITEKISATEEKLDSIDDTITIRRTQISENTETISAIRLNASRLVSRNTSYQRVEDGFLQRFAALQSINAENPQLGLIASFVGAVIALIELMSVLMAHFYVHPASYIRALKANEHASPQTIADPIASVRPLDPDGGKLVALANA